MKNRVALYNLVRCWGLILTIISSSAGSLFGQVIVTPLEKTVSLSGKVQTKTGESVVDAMITVTRTDSSLITTTVSDSSGKFGLHALTVKNFILRCSKVGYQTHYQTISLQDSSITPDLYVTLNTSEVKLNEVVVKEKRPMFEVAGDRIIINPMSNAAVAGGYAFDALSVAPRVTIDPISKSISIDGKSGIILVENDRQQNLPPDQIIAYLQSLPVSVISRIEILTNPPASYDAGSSGVILLYTKGLRKEGFTGEASFSAGAGRYLKANASVNLSLRTARLQGNFMYAPGYKPTYYSWVSDQFLTSSRTPTTGYAHSNEFNIIDNRSQLIRTNWDWAIGKTLSVGTVIMGSQVIDISKPSSNLSYRMPGELTKTTQIDANTINSHRIGNLAINLHAIQKFADKKSSLSVDADIDHYQDNTTAQSEFTQQLPDIRPMESLLIRYPSQIDIKTGKIDFSRTYSKKGLLELGIKYSAIDMQNLPEKEFLSAGFNPLEPRLVKAYTYSEKTSSVYVNVNNSWKRWAIQTGLRLEHTQYAGLSDFVTAVNRNYTNLFPSLSIKHTTTNNAQASLSINRRIIRPAFNSLNPAFVFIDPLTLYSGNPLLIPQLTTTLQSSYITPKRVSFTLIYSDSRNRMAEVVYRFDSTTATTLDHIINFDWEKRFSAVLAVPIQITSTWLLQASVSGANSQFFATFADRPTRTGQTTAIIRLNNALTLKKWSATANLTYRTTAVVGYMLYDPLWYLDLGLQRSIGKRGTFKIAASDVFHTLLITNHGDYLNTNIIFRHRYESQRVMFTYSFVFGSKKSTQLKEGSFGSDSEQERLNNATSN